MYFLSLLVLVLHIYFAAHSISNDRAEWFYIILFFPGAGCLLYFFIEYLPGIRHSKNGFDFSAILEKLAPDMVIKKHVQELSYNNCLENRLKLARLYLRLNKPADAAELLRKSLSGVYETEPETLRLLGIASFETGEYTECLQIAEKIEKEQPRLVPREIQLLKARCFEELQEYEKAVYEYEKVVRQSTGEEARCRYAGMLQKLGNKEYARELYSQILTAAARSPRYYRRREKLWIKTAREMIAKEEAL